MLFNELNSLLKYVKDIPLTLDLAKAFIYL